MACRPGPKGFDLEILRLTLAGLSAPRIAQELGVSERTVSRARVRTGCGQDPSRPYTAEELLRAEEMLNDGASIAEVARTLGRDLDQCYLRWRGRGWTPEQTGEYNRMRQQMSKLLTQRAPGPKIDQ